MFSYGEIVICIAGFKSDKYKQEINLSDCRGVIIRYVLGWI